MRKAKIPVDFVVSDIWDFVRLAAAEKFFAPIVVIEFMVEWDGVQQGVDGFLIPR